MHETRNFLVVLVLVASVIWAIVAWFVLNPEASATLAQRVASVVIALGAAAWLIYAFKFEDKLPNHLKEALGGIYYETDGLCFLPIVRMNGDQAEISVYYQNRYEGPAQAVVHLRPPEDSFVIKAGMRDVHFAFKADGGDYGVIHQPIAVPRHLQGEVIEVQLAAASHYPRAHGARLRREAGLPCGSLLVDWGGAAFKSGVHEVSGEIELINPVTLHLSMPTCVQEKPSEVLWKQERLAEALA